MAGLTRESVHYYCSLVLGKSVRQEKTVTSAQEAPAPNLSNSSSTNDGKRTTAAVLPSGRALPPTPPEPKKRRKS